MSRGSIISLQDNAKGIIIDDITTLLMISVWLCFHDQALSDLSGHNEGTLEFIMILGGGLIFIEFPCETLLHCPLRSPDVPH